VSRVLTRCVGSRVSRWIRAGFNSRCCLSGAPDWQSARNQMAMCEQCTK